VELLFVFVNKDGHIRYAHDMLNSSLNVYDSKFSRTVWSIVQVASKFYPNVVCVVFLVTG
jgi:hypothetical protein